VTHRLFDEFAQLFEMHRVQRLQDAALIRNVVDDDGHRQARYRSDRMLHVRDGAVELVVGGRFAALMPGADGVFAGGDRLVLRRRFRWWVDYGSDRVDGWLIAQRTGHALGQTATALARVAGLLAANRRLSWLLVGAIRFLRFFTPRKVHLGAD